MGMILTWVIAGAVIGYAVFLGIRMLRRPQSCCGGCSGCPMAGKCHAQTEHDGQA